MEIITAATAHEYEEFVSSHPKGHFMQSLIWPNVKSEWKHIAVAHRGEDGKIIASMLLLMRKMPMLSYRLMYIPRGPVCDIHDSDMIRRLLEEAEKVARRNRVYQIKIDPDIPESDVLFADVLRGRGYRVSTGTGFEATQARFVFRVNLKDQSEQQIMERFHPKCRYNIRLAERKGVSVVERTKESLDEFMPIMAQTGKRDGFVVRPKKYFEKVLDAFGENARFLMAYYEDKPVAGTIEIRYGNKAWYLYGASGNEHRNVMPNYLVQWQMIQWAAESGCDLYDLRGVPGDLDETHPQYGLYRFKKGFGGDLIGFIGEYNLTVRKLGAFLVAMAFWGRSVLRKLKGK